MSQLNNPLEIYKLLPKSNCRQCQVPTCMAFAAAVINSQKRLNECPYLERNIIEQFEGKIEKRMTMREQALELVRKGIATIDFSLSLAERIGAALSGDKLKIKCLSNNFFIDPKGNVTSDCHINEFVVVPLFNYVLHCAGKKISGQWVSFKELKNGPKFNPLFEQRCEIPLKQLAKTHMDLLEDILYILGGRPTEVGFTTDISLTLYPLPKVPILICYRKPEDNLESKFNLFFDTTAEDNLNIESIYLLGVGIADMLKKITLKHA